MLKMKNAQGMSITVIIVAIIGFMVLIAVIMIFSGKFDDFRSGIGKAVTCEDACKVIGFEVSSSFPSAQNCKGPNERNKVIPGKYSDIPEDRVCCCLAQQ